jgi:hypothetical protein
MSLSKAPLTWTRVFPTETSKYHTSYVNLKTGPFSSAEEGALNPWANHEDIYIAEGFTFPEPHPGLGTQKRWPSINPNKTGVKTIILDSHNNFTNWGLGQTPQFSSLSPDGTKLAVLNAVATNQWGVAFFDVKTTGDYDVDYIGEIHLAALPLGISNFAPLGFAIDNSSNIYLATYGCPYTVNDFYQKLFFRKFDSSGILQWTSGAWYQEHDQVLPALEAIPYGIWGHVYPTYRGYWEEHDFTTGGPSFRASTWWSSKPPASIQFQMQIARDSSFADIFIDDTLPCISDCTYPQAIFEGHTWAEFGYGMDLRIQWQYDTPYINFYSRTRAIIDGVTGDWSSIRKMHPYFLGTVMYDVVEWTSNNGIESLATWPSTTVHNLRSTTRCQSELKIIGDDLHIVFGGEDITYKNPMSNYYLPAYDPAGHKVFHLSVALTGGAVTEEPVDTPSSGERAWVARYSASKCSGIEMLANGSDLYLCPSVFSPWGTFSSYPAYVLVRHGGVWGRLHLHLPVGVGTWQTATNGCQHLFMFKDKPVFLGMGNVSAGSGAALSWFYCELDPTVQDQTLIKVDMPQFTYVYGGTTYYYGYWGGAGCGFQVGVEGKSLYATGVEALSAPTGYVYRFSIPIQNNAVWYMGI